MKRTRPKPKRPLIMNHWIHVYCEECHYPGWGACRARGPAGCLQPIDANWPIPEHEEKVVK